ncbi:MAG: GtrA family protein [Caulobacteraceae bacterium]
MTLVRLRREGLIALKFAAVGGLGFLTDISVLRLCLRVLHLSPFEGRAISLACAMQVTFLVNGLLVFRCLSWRTCGRQWLAYMAANGFGNLINYLVFVSLIASRLPEISRNGWALVTGSAIAYVFNFMCVRLMVFGAPRGHAPAVHPMCKAVAE